MDPNILARLNAHAEDAAVMALRIEDLEAERDTYREMLSVSLDAIRDLTADTRQPARTASSRAR